MVEENKLKLKETWLNMKDWLLHKYPCRGAPRSSPTLQTSRKDSPICIYCLGPTLEGQKNDHWAPGSLAGRKWQTRTAIFESLGENMARPASCMSENVDFRPRWASVKPLGENVDPNTWIWLFNHVFTRVLRDSSFFTNRNTLGAWERLLEAIRGVGKLSLLLFESPSSSMEVLPLLGWRGWWAMKLKVEMQMGGAIEPWAVFKNLGRGIVSTLWFQFLPYSSIL